MPTLTRLSSSPVSLTLRFAIIALAVHGALDLVSGVLAQEQHTAYVPITNSPGSIEDRVAALERKLEHVESGTDAITVTGANLFVVNGEGITDSTNGLGNIVVGYNEKRLDDKECQGGSPPELPDWCSDERDGSHMLVAGTRLNFTRFGGVVVGYGNLASGPFSSVTGGALGQAAGDFASVTGGRVNKATGSFSTVSGGEGNTASGDYGTVSAGSLNQAEGPRSAVSGGHENLAADQASSVFGGSRNRAIYRWSTVSGGVDNTAARIGASVSGGSGNQASGQYSTVSGGADRRVFGDYNWEAGSLLEER